MKLGTFKENLKRALRGVGQVATGVTEVLIASAKLLVLTLKALGGLLLKLVRN